jgi:pimeloyl-ACP methyl ester carboxylesterase
MPDTRPNDRVSTAVVMANGVETTYRRCGSGRTVLLLGASEAIALALGASFRVIVPEVPFRLLDAAEWLGGVCDGLGIAEAVIIATPALTDAASRFAQEAPDRVKGVIITDSSAPDLDELRAAVERSFS